MSTEAQQPKDEGEQTLVPSGARSIKALDLQADIDRRFLEEIQQILDGGYAETPKEISAQLGIDRNYFTRMRGNRYHAKLPHIRRLKDVFNADYHHILFGVPHPDVEKRGLRKPAGPPSPTFNTDELHGWIDYRFFKEIERLEREGRVKNRQWLSEKIALSRDLFTDIRRNNGHYQPYHLVLFKQNLNADYHFILWGVERKEISEPYRITSSGTMRLDVYKPYKFSYSTPPNWHPAITDRRPDDEEKRQEISYYLDLKRL